ncbi:MAG: hypothetical protein AAF727_04445 [Pseudomonadota bacterium]
MKRLAILALVAVLAVLPASAGPIEDSIVRQLREQGFEQIEVRRTLLGRSRIVARSASLYREIVINPVSGEILRDFWRNLANDDRSGPELVSPGGGSPGADEDDDDRNDDRDGDDSDGGDEGGGDDD